MSKYYFDASEEDHEHCYTLDYFRRKMKDEGVKEMTLVEAKPAYGTGFFYCREYEMIGQVGEGCGKECKAYKPRNGKNGRCCFSATPYEESDKKIQVNAK